MCKLRYKDRARAAFGQGVAKACVMQVLSKLLFPLAACWNPKAGPQPPPAPETTRQPKAPGQWMGPEDVRCIRVRYYGPDAPQAAVKTTALAAPKMKRTCVVHNFRWPDAAATPVETQTYYASRIAREGVFSGWLEAEVLGALLGVRVGIWDRPHGAWFRWLSTQGASDPKAPLVHLVNIDNVHWCALVPDREPAQPWWQIDAGGAGDCLFHALNAAIAKHPEAAAPPKAPALRQVCAAELANNAAYQERIVTLSQQAWAEWHAMPMWRKASNRIGRRLQRLIGKRVRPLV